MIAAACAYRRSKSCDCYSYYQGACQDSSSAKDPGGTDPGKPARSRFVTPFLGTHSWTADNLVVGNGTYNVTFSAVGEILFLWECDGSECRSERAGLAGRPPVGGYFCAGIDSASRATRSLRIVNAKRQLLMRSTNSGIRDAKQCSFFVRRGMSGK